MSSSSSSSTSSKVFPNNSFPSILPKLIVFDLDNTLWTPELYQLNWKLRQKKQSSPRANVDIHLFPDVITILSDIQTFSHEYRFQKKHTKHTKQTKQTNNDAPCKNSITLAIASRTTHYSWAYALLSQFQIPHQHTSTNTPLQDFFPNDPLIQIVKGSKQYHFDQLRQHTGIPYTEMIFFDDDKHMNCHEISSRLGVLCSHCPNGLTLDIFRESLLEYARLKEGTPVTTDMGYILTESSLGICRNEKEDNTAGVVQTGKVKFYSSVKKYGFLQNVQTGEDLFVHESKIPAGMTLSKGQRVLFEQIKDRKGRASAIIVSSSFTKSKLSTSSKSKSMSKSRTKR